MPSETRSNAPTPNLATQRRAERVDEINALQTKLTDTRQTIEERRNRVEERRVLIDRTRIGYRHGIPPHLLRGTHSGEIDQYAQQLKQWKG